MTSARLVEPPSAGSFPGNALLPSLFDRTSDQRYHRKTPVHGPERLPSRRDPRDLHFPTATWGYAVLRYWPYRLSLSPITRLRKPRLNLVRYRRPHPHLRRPIQAEEKVATSNRPASASGLRTTP